MFLSWHQLLLFYADFLFLLLNSFRDFLVTLILNMVSGLDLRGYPFLNPETKSEMFCDLTLI